MDSAQQDSNYAISSDLFYESDSSFMLRDSSKVVLRISDKGQIFWNGREVEGDEQFKAAMMDLHNYFCKGI